MSSLPNYYQASQLDKELGKYSEIATPLTWTCHFCQYPRRITEAISTDYGEPCVFCLDKIMKLMGGSMKSTIEVPSPDGNELVSKEVTKAGVNSKNPPTGEGGDDSELLVEPNTFEPILDAVKRRERKTGNLRKIIAFVNQSAGDTLDAKTKASSK